MLARPRSHRHHMLWLSNKLALNTQQFTYFLLPFIKEQSRFASKLKQNVWKHDGFFLLRLPVITKRKLKTNVTPDKIASYMSKGQM